MRIRQILDEREEFGKTPGHFLAMILDPRNRGVSLNQSQRKEALELLQKKVLKNPVFADKCGQIMNEYYNWLSKAGPFADARDAFQVLEYGIETVPWWKGSFPDLSLPDVVSFVYSVPATSAAAERNWSLRGATHTPSRNRLLVDTATKMTYIKHNLLLIDGSKKKPQKQHLHSAEASTSENMASDEDVNDSEDPDEEVSDGASGSDFSVEF